ncbi:MAG TPA: tRNA preQ1(34) S-adenosylmethionine ribosyltransferase-isomerase QueA [Polyangia bacterium]|nr:tRNA preQ1(34) S-adenosylmethionine ribosyltransferase-isomerase QueA [Polyangia bacterium]
MRTSDFDYLLPPERIAAHPPAKREEARLLILDKKTGKRSHKDFFDLNAFLPPASLVVINDTRVLPARLRGTKTTGGAIEIILTRRSKEAAELGAGVEIWEALGRSIPRQDRRPTFVFGDLLSVTVVERRERGALLVAVRPAMGLDVLAALDRVGEVPLPPYIEAARRLSTPGDDGRATASDRERYQSVYARHPGAVAAPTAGLHFTPELLAQLTAAGHSIAPITLHVGPGTFRPVETEEIAQHRMDAEVYEIPRATADAINDARRSGRPIVAVGTTVVRTLETAARVGPGGEVPAGPGESRLFLAPGSEFRVVTDLITNFHLPRSTLLMLVAAFAGRDAVLAAYEDAIARGYRFYSYGDAMLITWSRAAA